MRKLLIAEDEIGVRVLVKFTLEEEGIEILEAANGIDALRLAREHRPDVVLLDVMMPGLSGFDVCRALKEDPTTAGMVVVMLTAKAQDSDRKKGEAVGADDYLTKPFSPISLIDKVDEFLSRKQAP
jgi:DNA-binding response OmpR family regulator